MFLTICCWLSVIRRFMHPKETNKPKIDGHRKKYYPQYLSQFYLLVDLQEKGS